jgi:DNA-binding winged helix-turn-helix (wHTH) protein
VRNESLSVLDHRGERATLAIGSFRLDVDTATLYRGNDPLPVGRRAVALLSALAKRQGLVVSKDELIQAAWSGLAVEESNLSVQIAALRKALAAEPGGGSWIETLPRRGYRFVGPTTTSSHRSAIDEEKVSSALGVRLAIPSPGAAGDRSQEGSIARRSRWLVGRNGPLATLDKVTQRMPPATDKSSSSPARLVSARPRSSRWRWSSFPDIASRPCADSAPSVSAPTRHFYR